MFSRSRFYSRPDPGLAAGKGRTRLRSDKFRAIFNRIVAQARGVGLVHDRLRIIDATPLAAKVDLFRLPAEVSDTAPAEATGSPDTDERFGRKNATKNFYSYKKHLSTGADSDVLGRWWTATFAR